MSAGADQTLIFDRALLPDGWASSVRVEIAGGVIGAVTANSPSGAGERVAGMALPGMANVHSHAFQRGLAGLAEWRGAEDDDFWSWREVMYRFLAVLDPDDVEAVSSLAYMEMLEAGFTSVGEFHYLHNDPAGQPYPDPATLAARIVRAAEATGIGLTLLPVFYAHGDFGGAPPTTGQRRFVLGLDAFVGLVEACRRLGPDRLGIAPHSLRAVTPAELEILAGLSPAAPFHIHAAEQEREVERSVAVLGARPVAWLIDHLAVDRRWCLIHATHLDASERVAFARTGATAGLCPQTEANLGDGIFPATDYLGQGGAIGIGSDSNIAISVAHELRALDYSQRLRDRARNRLATPDLSTGRRLYTAASEGGAQALGRPGGRIAVGASADFLVLDPNHPALVGRDDDRLLDSWVFTASGAIQSVYVAGRQVVEHGRHVDRERIIGAWRRCAARLKGLV